ncbi:uncharacterized protein SPAPADRAFT_143563 [Spathaspora passalidarum NRRL Y-27907]|uniref:Rho-GAP domain-containing protein n=1 Tax=Spathaspora passalidarum (strain NRRL Y-27907 / 11-Y1) TaxID=619300 RepID=G3AU44_SPAPN|nr:uncharacterized protein SPAPADRAFT_143563 [Spathaspora passalidarum NRRL Y-27907]EGW30420.1 hypothetical protein SPAPADRAFT_143563 [Spathaspora passalidarum NRRL Y-27907]
MASPTHFANSYWSSDYKTAIDQLQNESTTSLAQLHELRKLVFSYINYFTGNSEYLDKSSNDLLPRSSPFSVNKASPSRRRVVSASVVASESVTPQPDSVEEITMSMAYNNYINHMKFDSQLLIQMASIIDRDVLEEITQFLKYEEPKLKGEVSRLQEAYIEYLTSFNKIEKLKSRHQEQLRLKEFNDSSIKISIEDTSVNDSIASDDSYTTEADSSIIDSTKAADNGFDEFEFPLKLGSAPISNRDELRDLMNQLISKVPTIKRKIPIPGYKPDIFSSDSLCGVVSKMRLRGLTPSRMNLERFGQSLLDMGLIVTSQFLASKKFKSEGMWFEWSDLAYFVREYDDEATDVETPTLHATALAASPSSTKFQSEVAETTKRLNAMFNSVKSSIMKTNHDEMLIDIQQKYEQEYLSLEELKFRLENGTLQITQYLQEFEKNKIEIVYKSLSRLSEILNRFSHKQAETLEHFSNDFINRINRSANYQHDLQLVLKKYSTGIYFPSNTSPEALVKKSPGQSGAHYQNLKYQFNLYKDIPLQLQVGQLYPASLLSITSIPYILYQAIKIIETDHESCRKYWLSPIDYQSVWEIKQDIIMLISNFTPDLNAEISNERLIQGEFLNKVVEYLKGKSIENVVCFLKSWLLEISDSCIPFVVYDSIAHIYSKENTVDELLKQLSTIPRSNLATLVFVLEHISRVFDMSVISQYEVSDEIEEGEDEANLEEVAAKLNSMDEIGAVPFVHLIMRPSVVKHSSGFKPPIETYVKFLQDLLKLKVRSHLLKKLIDNEQTIKRKRLETEKNGLSLKRVSLVVPEAEPTIPTTPKKETTNMSLSIKSPRPVSGEFSLRPFRTRATPQPSPRGSPTRSPVISRESSPVRSGSVLLPTVKIE